MQDWPSYLAGFHDESPGITERVLARAVHGEGPAPYAWLVEALPREQGDPVLDLACGSAPTRPLMPGTRWIGLDSSPGELGLAVAGGRGPVVRGRGEELPVAEGSVSAVSAAMCMQMLTPLDVVLAEVKRVLWPGGRVVALVPSTMLLPRRGTTGWWKVLRALGLRSQPWPNPNARDGLAKILRGAGFVIDSDERRVFRREIADRGDAEVLVDGLYLPGVEPARIQAARDALARWARPGRTLPLPLRRVVAHLGP